MRLRSALLCLSLLTAFLNAHAQEEEDARLPLRIFDAASATPVPSVEISLPSGALLTLGDAYGFASIPAFAADSPFLTVGAEGYHTDTLFPPFGEEVFLRRIGDRALEEIVVRPDAPAPVTPSRRDAVIDYSFVGDYLLVATTRAPRRNALLLLGPRGDTIASTTLRDEPDGVYTACDGIPYVIFAHLNRFQPVSSVQTELQLGKRCPMRLLPGVQACQLERDNALYYRSFSPEDFALSLWRWRSADTAPQLFVQRIDTVTARVNEMEDGSARPRRFVRTHYGEDPEEFRLRMLRNKFVYREMAGNLMLLHDTLLLPDFRTRSLVHYNSEGKELATTRLRFSWGSLVQFSLLQDAATGRIYLHRYTQPQLQTLQELDPRTGALVGRQVSIRKAFPQKVKVRGGRVFYLWQDDKAKGTKQLFTEVLATSR